MSGEKSTVAKGVRASTSGGTPKRGYACNTCLDWGTVSQASVIGDGATLERTRPCPDCQPDVDAGPVAWLRRCNDQPAEGILTTYAEAKSIPYITGTEQVRGSLTTGLTWRGAGRTFTLEPLTADQLAAWKDRRSGVPVAQSGLGGS